jgi:predicted dinucleotide-binding enzyme
MARAIATRLLAGGHEVTLLGREAGEGEGLARELGGSARAGAVGEPVAGDGLSGKVVVDITNPVDWQTFDGLVTPPDSSAAEEIQAAAAEGARVVKAWNTTFAGTLVAGEVAGQPLDVFVAGSNAIDAGPLRRARELERLGFLGMTLQQPLGLNFQSAWKLIS